MCELRKTAFAGGDVRAHEVAIRRIAVVDSAVHCAEAALDGRLRWLRRLARVRGYERGEQRDVKHGGLSQADSRRSRDHPTIVEQPDERSELMLG
jgi:hypothetical protein